MAKLNLSTKRLQIDKANSRMVLFIAIAAFVVSFCLVASRALLSTRAYQSRVVADKEKAVKQLKANLTAANSLVASYKQFVSASTNVIGGNSNSQGEKDGDNAKIVLDALPSKYDFPALTTSLEKILTDPSYKIDAITGTDDEVAQSNNASSTPQPVEVPFHVTVTTPYASLNTLLATLERSIRPFQIESISLSGTSSTLRVDITAKTFYQPEKNVNISTKEVK